MAKVEPVVPKAARDYLSRKKLKPSFHYAEVWKEEHGHAFTVAKMLEADLLMETKRLLVQSINEGKTFADFQRELRPQLIERGWWGQQEVVNPNTGKTQLVQLGSNQRLKTIYETNMRTAHAAGNWQRIERNKETHPYLIYQLGAANEHRQEHIAWDGLVLPVDDKFWDTHYPSNGWGCKCRVRQISKHNFDKLKTEGVTMRAPELDNQGRPTGRFKQNPKAITTQAPKIETRELVNKHTGEVMRVPKGIDAGWDYNMGKGTARAQAQQKQLVTKQKTATKILNEPLDTRQIPAIYSSVPNVTTEKLTACLKGLPESCQPQVNQLFSFLGDKQTKSLFVKASEMSIRSKATMQVESTIGAYLARKDVRFARALYTTQAPNRVGGFTSIKWDHVVVKVKSTANLNKIEPQNVVKSVATAISKYKGGHTYSRLDPNGRAFTFSNELGDNDGLVTTWLHEVAHQIHYYAGDVEVPKEAKRLTYYSHYSHREYHAEHFVAWLLDREALYAFDPITAKHMDNVVSNAIKAKSK